MSCRRVKLIPLNRLVPSNFGLAYVLLEETNSFQLLVAIFQILHFERTVLLSRFYCICCIIKRTNIWILDNSQYVSHSASNYERFDIACLRRFFDEFRKISIFRRIPSIIIHSVLTKTKIFYTDCKNGTCKLGNDTVCSPVKCVLPPCDTKYILTEGDCCPHCAKSMYWCPF